LTFSHQDYTAIFTFAPQAVLNIAISILYKDLSMAMFLQTFVFVMYNKVCTSQVFDTIKCNIVLFVVFVLITCSFAETEVFSARPGHVLGGLVGSTGRQSIKSN
jgi:uncharacterized membrane protein